MRQVINNSVKSTRCTYEDFEGRHKHNEVKRCFEAAEFDSIQHFASVGDLFQNVGPVVDCKADVEVVLNGRPL